MNKQTLIIGFLLFTLNSFSQNYYRNWNVKKETKKENIALIIANNHYESSGSLSAPIPTANELEEALSKKGFDIMVGHDLNRRQMSEIVNDFSSKFQSYKFVMIFYLGHGFQIDGENFLIPIDANPKNKSDVEIDAIKVDYILRKINNQKIPKVIVLDACRDNPFAVNWVNSERANIKNGFGDLNAPLNAEIFFTTQKESRVRDDNPYIKYFIEELAKNICLDEIVRNVSKRIFNFNQNQIPAKYGQLFDEVCFGYKKPNPNPQPNSKDSDNDGVIDSLDKCPYQFGSVDNNGCPVNKSIILEWERKGLDLYNKKEYDGSKEWSLKAADNGSALGQRLMGHIYYLEGDNISAIKYYKLCSEKGMIGRIYYEERDYEKAMFWYEKLAKIGNANAQFYLGNIYAGDMTGFKDMQKAEYWYLKSAKQGNSSAQNNLGHLYFYNQQDYDSAIFWYKKSIIEKPINTIHLGRAYELKKDYEKAIYWYKKGTEIKIEKTIYKYTGRSSSYSIGKIYKDIYKDISMAKYWFQKSCDNIRFGCNELKK